MIIPHMPNKLPRLDVAGLANPFRAKIKQIAAIK
jgi:hypothetical protein